MSAPVTVWNPHSWPVQVSEDGLMAPGMTETVIDLDDTYAARAVALGQVAPVSGEVVAPPAVEVVADSPQADVESNDETAVADDSVEMTDDDAKPTKSTRSKLQASKES